MTIKMATLKILEVTQNFRLFSKSSKLKIHTSCSFGGGDTFHVTPPILQSKYESLIPVLNELGLDVMIGHWDFAYIPKNLLKSGGQLNYPVLACYVYDDDRKSLWLQNLGNI